MKQSADVSNIEITDGNIKAFESTAKKYTQPTLPQGLKWNGWQHRQDEVLLLSYYL